MNKFFEGFITEIVLAAGAGTVRAYTKKREKAKDEFLAYYRSQSSEKQKELLDILISNQKK